MTLWMSAPSMEAVKHDAYTHGPVPEWLFCPDIGDIIVAKDCIGRTILLESWEGEPLLIPETHIPHPQAEEIAERRRQRNARKAVNF